MKLFLILTFFCIFLQFCTEKQKTIHTKEIQNEVLFNPIMEKICNTSLIKFRYFSKDSIHLIKTFEKEVENIYQIPNYPKKVNIEIYNWQNDDINIEWTSQKRGEFFQRYYSNTLKIGTKIFYINEIIHQKYNPKVDLSFEFWNMEVAILVFDKKKYLLIASGNGNLQNGGGIKNNNLFFFDITNKNQTQLIFYDTNYTRNPEHLFCGLDKNLEYISIDLDGKAVYYKNKIENNQFIKSNTPLKLKKNN